MTDPKCVDFCQRVKTKRNVIYNQFGTRTGRLTTTEKSFPILTFPKLFRGMVEPYNHVLLEVDVVSAEVATLFYLNDRADPKRRFAPMDQRAMFWRQTRSRQVEATVLLLAV